ncbi:unnamed protein product, partial [Mesorhabditis belari]|uniref:Uncharacterized protein n=1 Tax=Mesorhabditis belari TaxID=2138241 RepID=A0AAF3J927_9BILA
MAIFMPVRVLSINRFMAVSFNEVYFKKRSRFVWLQAGFAVIGGFAANYFGTWIRGDQDLLYISLAPSLDLLQSAHAQIETAQKQGANSDHTGNS